MAHILLAEDDYSMQSFISLALTKAGHTVTTKPDGTQALEALENPKNHFDILLTDIVMPGIDGIELSQKATQLHPHIKIMFITGFAAVAMEEQKNQPVPTQILSKPFHLNDLVKQVQSILIS